ncbi:MAG: hypothetical protein JOZ58_05835, partial [Acetobacteraceae bacterium]|nr:hypothetical protein [Acetobacteraceae bacterium]
MAPFPSLLLIGTPWMAVRCDGLSKNGHLFNDIQRPPLLTNDKHGMPLAPAGSGMRARGGFVGHTCLTSGFHTQNNLAARSSAHSIQHFVGGASGRQGQTALIKVLSLPCASVAAIRVRRSVVDIGHKEGRPACHAAWRASDQAAPRF